MNESGFGRIPGERYLSKGTVPALKGRRSNAMEMFSGVGTSPLVPVRGDLNASADQDILDNSILPNFCALSGKSPFWSSITVSKQGP